MAHNLNIDEKTGEASLYLLKEKAWHGLGQVAEEAKSSEEVIKIAHLDWDVIKSPNFVQIGEDFMKCGSISTVRSDNGAVLGNRLTNDYTVVQNSEAFKFMDSLVVNASDIKYETAGALGKGEVVFVTAKLPGYLRIGKSDDVIDKYFILANSHDASSQLTLFFSLIKPVCNNTLSAAMRQCTNRVAVRHTASIQQQLELGRKLMEMSLTYSDALQGVLTRLAEVRVDEKYVKDFAYGLFLTPEEIIRLADDELGTRKLRTINEILESFELAPGQDEHKGTALNLFNGVTSYLQNVKTYRSQDRKFKGLNLGGEESLITQKAFNTLFQLV